MRASLVQYDKCHFLYLIGQLGPGGSERQLYFLLKTMDRSLYHPEVVVWRFRPDEMYVKRIRELGVTLHSFPETFSRVDKLRAFRRLVLKIKPELIHSFSFYTNFAVWWAVRRTSIISLGSCRGDFEYERTGSGPILARLSGRWPRHQICNSFVTAETASKLRSLFVPEDMRVVRNGVDLEIFQSAPIPNVNRAVILGVGSLLKIKRWDRALMLAAKLKNTGVDFLLRIAGDGPLRESLERATRDRCLTSNVEFIGHSEDVPALLGSANFLIHTSDAEGCPNAVIEAMACGRAVVATDVGDVRCLIEDKQTGFVVPRGDDELFLDRVMKLLTDYNLCRRMGEAARAKAVHEFGLRRLIEETLNAYRAFGWQENLNTF